MIPSGKNGFFNLCADHMTLLVDPALYRPFYAILRVILGVPKARIVYEKSKLWPGADKEASMTYAAELGDAFCEPEGKAAKTILAVVQPTEPKTRSSHVREMLAAHGPSALLQHVALRTPDLFAFHAHALARGVNFITPIMREDDEDLLQVFSGELYLPGHRPSGLFFEFVQRDVSKKLLKKLLTADRQALFKDRTFLGLYDEKEREYKTGKVTPFIDHALMRRIQALVSGKDVGGLSGADLGRIEAAMLQYAARREKNAA